jgi:hypothetical protein
MKSVAKPDCGSAIRFRVAGLAQTR